MRTGCFCNPGAGEQAFGLTAQVVHGPRWRAFPPPNVPTVDDYLELIGLPSGGAVRVSLGLVSNIRDVERFLDFAERTYRDQEPGRARAAAAAALLTSRPSAAVPATGGVS